MFSEVFRFELNYHRRQYLVYILSGVFFLLTFLATTTDNVSMGPRLGNININAPLAVISTLSTLSILALFGAVAFAASGVIRDFELKTAEIFLTTRVSKLEYLYGRFFGSLVFSFAIYFGGMFGVLAGEFMPWLDAERIGAFTPAAYWFSTWVIVLPNLFIASCIFFCLATITRSMMFTYVAAIALLMLTIVVGSFSEPDTVELTSKLDPFGITALQESTRYWTVFEKNELIPVLEGSLLVNRVIWMMVGLFFLALPYFLFPFSIEASSRGSKWFHRKPSKLANPETVLVTDGSEIRLSAVTVQFGIGTHLLQYLAQTRLEVRNIVFSAPFIVLMLVGLLNVVGGAAGNLGNLFGTSVYPITPALVEVINGSLALSLLGVLIYYSGELMLKERAVKFSEIMDSLPYPNWVMMASKLTGLLVVILMMLVVAILAGVGVQIYNDFYEFDLLVYFKGLFFFFQFPLYFMCVLSIFFYVITRGRYISMFLMILYVVALLAMPQLGFEHYLYRMDKPNVRYSAFTAFSHQLEPFLWYTFYWSMWGLMLLIAIHLLWPRGSEFTLTTTLAVARQRFTPAVKGLTALFVIFLAGSGGYIFYNTNILNTYASNLDLEEQRAEYEQTFKQYQYMSKPSIRKVYAEVDIFAAEREVSLAGHYEMVNDSSEPLNEIHFTTLPWLTISTLNVPGATLQSNDETSGYRIYRFAEPLAVGEAIKVTFITHWLTPGFQNNGASMKLTANGTFFNNQDIFPVLGYRAGAELQDNARRRKFDLPAIKRMSKIDDEAALSRSALGDADRIEFETIVSTDAGQTAIAPGYLQRQWQEGERQYFHYKMDAPIWNFFSYLSGDYAQKSDSWNDVKIEVYYKHEYNVDTMIRSTRKSLDYFSENFSPYQYRQFRIIEFPRYQGAFAQSFPNTIPFSEGIGFVADLRDKADIDYVFYVTAHELAHQWWAHQVLGADVQGQTMIVESLSQYSALMVMEKEYGKDHMKRFLEFELDRYLRDRGGELIEELPLSLVENQPYIHYRKGSVALYALQDYIGEAAMNAALQEFIALYAFKDAPYPTTRELIGLIRARAGPQHQALITDLLEKIVLYDLKVERVSVEELDSGDYEVTMDLSLAKFEATGGGQESEVPVNGIFDVALLGEQDEETEVPEILYLKKYPINENARTIKIISKTRPVRVGIDPFNKLIDRNPDDNIKALDS